MSDRLKNRPHRTIVLLLAGVWILLMPVSPPALAQDEPSPPHNPTVSDVIETGEASITITPIAHASILFEVDGRHIYVDPVGDFSQMQDRRADIVLITDIHGDHLNADSVRSITKTGAVVIAPPEVSNTIRTAIIYRNGESSAVSLGGVLGRIGGGRVGIEAVPAYNLTRGPSEGQLYHPKGRGQGYVMAIGETRIFVSGDTECVPEIQALEDIDVAFLPMNLPFTMTPEEAAECVQAFRPGIVYPYHYRGQDPQAFADALAGEADIEVRLREWY